MPERLDPAIVAWRPPQVLELEDPQAGRRDDGEYRVLDDVVEAHGREENRWGDRAVAVSIVRQDPDTGAVTVVDEFFEPFDETSDAAYVPRRQEVVE